MNPEEQLIKTFYTNFQQYNWRGMVECYADNIFFMDPVFANLEGEQVRAMWEMLLGRARGLTLSYNNIISDGGYGECNWVAVYTFPATGRKVANKGKARFTIDDGKIYEHYDEFNFWKWSGQALGIPGWLFGWTPVLHNSVQRKARANLEKFIKNRPPSSI